MRCGNCKQDHASVAEVRECYAGRSASNDSAASPLGEVAPLRLGPIPEEDRVYLNVLFEERFVAKKQFGAMWDRDKKQWYVKKSADFDEMPKRWLEPPKPQQRDEPVNEGFYRKDDEIYRVVIAVHGSGLPYAQRLTRSTHPEGHQLEGQPKGVWVRAPGMQFRLKPEEELSFEESCNLGKLYGFCVRCGITLTKPESIERGMGDICAGKG